LFSSAKLRPAKRRSGGCSATDTAKLAQGARCWTPRCCVGRTRPRSQSADRKPSDRHAFFRRLQKRLTPCPAEQLNSESGRRRVAQRSQCKGCQRPRHSRPTRCWRAKKNGCAVTASAQLRARTNRQVMGTKIALMEDGPGSYRFAFSSKRGEVSGRVTVGVEGPPDKRSGEDREQAAKNQILALSREFSEACEE
jgi:hypothetical protein